MSALRRAKSRLRRGDSPEAVAAEYLTAVEDEGRPFWLGSGELTSLELSGRVAEVGALLLSDRARDAGRALLKRVVVVDRDAEGRELVRSIGEIPLDQMRVYALSHLAWALLIAGDWSLLPPLPRGRGRLSPRATRAYGAIRALFAASVDRDQLAIDAAIDRLAALESGRPALVALGIRRAL